MSKFTRKRGLPAALVLALGIIGALAVFVAVAVQPGVTQAQDDPCDGPFAALFPQCDDGSGGGSNGGSGGGPTDPGGTPDPTTPPMAGDVKIESSSTSGSATVELKLTIKLDRDVPVGGAFVLYLEDDFQEPDSISASDVYFVSSPAKLVTGNGSRVYTTVNPEIDTSDYFTADKDDIDIRVSVPDMCSNNEAECEGANGLEAGDTVTMVIRKSAGIKNPSEAGTHSVGASVLGPTDDVGDPQYADALIDGAPLSTVAKIGLSDVDNKRGYEMTVTGSGFNDGTSAAVYVLHDPTVTSDMLSGDAEMALCERIIRTGTKVGGALVGSDDKVAVTFEVTAPTFGPGNTNYICMVDGEGRASATDVEDFNLEPSIKVVPASVATGDTVNVFAQDYQNTGQGFTELKIAGGEVTITPTSGLYQSSRAIGNDGSGEVTIEIPGGLEGVLRIDARWGMPDGDPAKCDLDAPNPCISKNSKITIVGADLEVSKTEVRPNETITINGNGFGTQTCIPFSNITLDNVPVMVHEDSAGCTVGNAPGVEVSNSGQFVATIILWPASGSGGTNPTLIPGTHELSVEDTKNYSSSANLTIDEPSIMVTPDIAGPRDYITITGENWPVENLDNTLNKPVTVLVDDFGSAGRSYPVYADAVGRFTVEHRVHRRVAIPSDVQVKATYEDVAKIGSFAVPASTIEVSPSEGQPGDMVTLTAANMPVYNEVNYIEIGGTRYDDPGVNTDRDGNVTVENVLIPGLDPGTYSVVINVQGTIAIGEIDVLAESAAAGAPAALPGAVEAVGDALVAIFYYDDVGKEWSFYDPRPEFADLNTLTEMVNGEAYWILVNETVDEVVLNNKVRSLTCRGDDCWNLEVW